MVCPNCQSDISVTEKDFGALYNCPKCHSSYFINFEGQAEYSDLPPPEQNSNEPPENFKDFSNENAAAVSAGENMEAEPFISFENSNIDSMNSFAAIESGFEPMIPPTADVNMASDFAGIASQISSFGNSETQLSTLNYDLKISGLDAKEDVLALKDLIEDSRFTWDAPEILRQIKNGELTLKKLNPVQAFILAKRLHFIDIKLEWEQNVLE